MRVLMQFYKYCMRTKMSIWLNTLSCVCVLIPNELQIYGFMYTSQTHTHSLTQTQGEKKLSVNKLRCFIVGHKSLKA